MSTPEPIEVRLSDWRNSMEEVRLKYDHVHSDGECILNRLGRKCGDVVHPRARTGTLYVDYDGLAYRLRGWTRSLSSEEGAWRPDYTVMGLSGMSTCYSLPEGARKVWEPPANPPAPRTPSMFRAEESNT